VDGLLSSIQNGGLSGATVSNVLGGQFDRSATGSVNIQGRINAAEGLSIMAGHGGTDTHAVTVSGQVVVNGRVAGSAVNLGDLKSLMPMQDVDGVIDITTPGSIMLNGMLISDSAQFTQAGAVRLVATNHGKKLPIVSVELYVNSNVMRSCILGDSCPQSRTVIMYVLDKTLYRSYFITDQERKIRRTYCLDNKSKILAKEECWHHFFDKAAKEKSKDKH